MGRWGFFDEKLAYFRAKEVLKYIKTIKDTIRRGI